MQSTNNSSIFENVSNVESTSTEVLMVIVFKRIYYGGTLQVVSLVGNVLQHEIFNVT